LTLAQSQSQFCSLLSQHHYISKNYYVEKTSLEIQHGACVHMLPLKTTAILNVKKSENSNTFYKEPKDHPRMVFQFSYSLRTKNPLASLGKI
jgi:hypothetical protein